VKQRPKRLHWWFQRFSLCVHGICISCPRLLTATTTERWNFMHCKSDKCAKTLLFIFKIIKQSRNVRQKYEITQETSKPVVQMKSNNCVSKMQTYHIPGLYTGVTWKWCLTPACAEVISDTRETEKLQKK